MLLAFFTFYYGVRISLVESVEFKYFITFSLKVFHRYSCTYRKTARCKNVFGINLSYRFDEKYNFAVFSSSQAVSLFLLPANEPNQKRNRKRLESQIITKFTSLTSWIEGHFMDNGIWIWEALGSVPFDGRFNAFFDCIHKHAVKMKEKN